MAIKLEVFMKTILIIVKRRVTREVVKNDQLSSIAEIIRKNMRIVEMNFQFQIWTFLKAFFFEYSIDREIRVAPIIIELPVVIITRSFN